MDVMDLPALRGTEKQVKWAGDLRSQKLVGLNAWVQSQPAYYRALCVQGVIGQAAVDLQAALLPVLVDMVKTQDDSYWWIARRTWSASMFLDEQRSILVASVKLS